MPARFVAGPAPRRVEDEPNRRPAHSSSAVLDADTMLLLRGSASDGIAHTLTLKNVTPASTGVLIVWYAKMQTVRNWDSRSPSHHVASGILRCVRFAPVRRW